MPGRNTNKFMLVILPGFRIKHLLLIVFHIHTYHKDVQKKSFAEGKSQQL